MRTNKTSWQRIVALASLVPMLLVVAPGAAARASTNLNPGVLPPVSTPYGLTYAQWSARWWQWAFSIPGPVNPLIDTTGAQCAQGQSGNVWFLAGLWVDPPLVPNTAVRTCTVPSGKALFFPVANIECDTVPPYPFPPDACRPLLVRYGLQQITDQEADVDGVQIQGLQTSGCPQASPSGDAFVQKQPSYCVGSDPFTLTLPDNNLYAYLYGPASPAGTYEGINAGIYLMLAPLSAGQHTVHIHVYAAPGMDVTYHLTIGS